jgi:HEPN domain-containing protein
MKNEQFDRQKLIDYWVTSSDDDFDTMMAMFVTRRYSWSLFVGHLVIEKLLKAYFVQVKEDYPPFIHNLLKLARDSDLSLDDDAKLKLTTITAFNLNTRYDDYKMGFQKRCTPEYTKEWVDKIVEIRQWIKKLIK